jgi:predicted DNA-binding transcriptional regulator AlpA
MEERLLRDTEAAELLATTSKTLAVWRCQKKGPKVTRIGRSIRYKLSEIEAFIKGLETT